MAHFVYGEDNDALSRFYVNYQMIASVQGYVSYMLMSIHIMNPSICYKVCTYSPNKFLYFSMMYGIAMAIYSRPSFRKMNSINPILFSVLGSGMFNLYSMKTFHYLKEYFSEESESILALIGFATGSFLLTQFIVFLYHMDTRIDPELKRMRLFEICLGK